MLYSDEIYIEDFKRTYTEAYRKGFIDGFNERGYLLTYIGNDHIKAEQGEPNCSEKPNNCEPQTYVINPQEPTNDDKCFECDDFFTCGGQCNKIKDEPTGYNLTPVEDEPQTDCAWK